MSSFEIEVQDLKEKNNELVKKVQYWKMTAAQKENEKLDLMKENNDLRLKLSRLRSGGAAHARKLDAEIQSASKQALSHLVQASSAVTRTVQLAKMYMQERQELETELPRWSSISNTPNNEKVHRVLPMLIGGQSIQPVVSLSRTMVNVNNLRTNRSPNNNQNHNFSESPLPMHLLQDLYIPLTRIDANGLPLNSMDVDPGGEEADVNNSAEDLGLDDSGDQPLRDSTDASDSEQYNDTPRLDAVVEDPESEEDGEPTDKNGADNPLEGPSWMLDGLNLGKICKTKSRVSLEPDSTTECDRQPGRSQAGTGSSMRDANVEVQQMVECERMELGASAPCEFSPTVRRRKRASSPHAPHTPHAARTPHYSPRPSARRNSNNGRILKVLVSKLRLDEDDVTPPKRPSLDCSPAKPTHSLPRPDHSPPTKRHSKNGSPKRPTSQSRDNSPVMSPTRRHARSNAQRQSRDRSLVRRQSKDRSLVRRQSRDNSSETRQTRDKSPSICLSRDVHVLSFDAPSPNGATTLHVVVSESTSPVDTGGSTEAAAARMVVKREERTSRDSRQDSRSSREVRHENRSSRDVKHDSHTSHDSDSGSSSDVLAEGRTRRPRKAVVYKEKPLNRKMRR